VILRGNLVVTLIDVPRFEEHCGRKKKEGRESHLNKTVAHRFGFGWLIPVVASLFEVIQVGCPVVSKTGRDRQR